MKRVYKVVLIVLGVVIVGYGGMALWFGGAVSEAEASRKFITTNPLDLEQIAAFSKYRSCVGHDFRGPDLTGRTEEVLSSMKHYVKVRRDLSGKNGVVKAIAPFDGKIFEVDDDAGGPGDQQIWLTPNSVSPRQWQFIFFHIDLRDDLKEGSEVKAGEIIGTANLARGPEWGTDNFDLAVKLTRPLHRPAIDSVFRHFSDELLADYASYGITPDELVITEAERQQRPCVVDSTINFGGPDPYFARETDPSDFVFLRR